MSTAWLIKGGLLLDGSANPPIADGAVLIRDGKIVAAGSTAEVTHQAKGDEQIIDASQHTIMPGLIDCHQHLDKSGKPMIGTREQSLNYSLEYNCIASVPIAKTVLEAGITSVRDIGCRGNLAIGMRDAVNQGLVPGPRIVASGNIISTTAGLVDFYNSWVSNSVMLGTIADGPEEIRKAVRRQIKDGVDNIKLEASCGFGGPRLPSMTVEEIRAACQEGHKREKTIAAHAEHLDAVKNALRGGVDTVEHGEYLDDEAVDLFLSNGTTLVATTSNLDRIRMNIAKGADSGMSATAMDEAKQRYDRWVEGFERAYDRGVKIAMGTDIANTNPHGKNAVELENLVRYGMSTADAIHAGTQVAAEAIRISSKTGTLSAGKWADILLVKGNPLEDIKILQSRDHLVVVMKGGDVVVDRSQLTKPAR